MRHILATKLILKPGSTEVSRPLSTAGYNTAQIDIVMFHDQSLTVGLEQSNDGENWTSLKTWSAGSDMTYAILSEVNDVATTLVRVRWTASNVNSDAIMVASDLNFTNV